MVDKICELSLASNCWDAAIVCIGFVISNSNIALIVFAAVIALVAALIVKPIASYVQKDLLQNSTVSTSFNNPNAEQLQAAGQTV